MTPIERARRAIEELEEQMKDKDLSQLMDDWKQALIKQYWERMTRYVK